MTIAVPSIVDDVDRTIEERGLFKHPLYQAWQCGEPGLDVRRCYAGQHHQHVLALPQYMSAAIIAGVAE